MIIVAIAFAVFTGAFSVLAYIGDSSPGLATFFAFAAFASVIVVGLVTLEHGAQKKQEGLREATIQCRTAECPYKLKTESDSTRVWVPRNE